MPEKTAPSVRARQLGHALRRLREKAGLSADQAARLTSMSQAKVSRIENAQSGVSRGDLVQLLSAYGVNDPEQHEEYWALVRAARERGWWEAHKLTAALSTYIAFEAEAARLRLWSWSTLSGLLQTKEYAHAILSTYPGRSSAEVDQLVTARIERQGRVEHSDVQVHAVIDEATLLRPFGGPGVMVGQLARLMELAGHPHVTVQVLRLPAEQWHVGISGSFTIMDFNEHPTVVFADALAKDLHVERPEEVAEYDLAFDWLQRAAYDPDRSREILSTRHRQLTGGR